MTTIKASLPMTQKYKRKEMSAVEIDRQLALAIGYRPEDVQITKAFGCEVRWRGRWHMLDHTHHTTIWPIAARYNCFPTHIDGKWLAETDTSEGWEDTPERAVAMAVIGGAR